MDLSPRTKISYSKCPSVQQLLSRCPLSPANVGWVCQKDTCLQKTNIYMDTHAYNFFTEYILKEQTHKHYRTLTRTSQQNTRLQQRYRTCNTRKHSNKPAPAASQAQNDDKHHTSTSMKMSSAITEARNHARTQTHNHVSMHNKHNRKHQRKTDTIRRDMDQEEYFCVTYSPTPPSRSDKKIRPSEHRSFARGVSEY